MKQDEVPKVDSINISTNPNELDWNKMISILTDRAEDGRVFIPGGYLTALGERMFYQVAAFIHDN